jgi:hypothetical protein
VGFLPAQNHQTVPKPFVFLMGRPGLDPGTGLKEGSAWSDSSGGVGMVRGKLRGIFEQPESFSVRVHVGPPIPTIPEQVTNSLSGMLSLKGIAVRSIGMRYFHDQRNKCAT